MNMYVLDSYALLQYFQNELSNNQLETILSECQKTKNNALLSLMNWGEIYYIVKRRLGNEHLQIILQHIEQLPITLVSMDEEMVRSASELKAQYPISYADAFCAATAQKYKAKVITGDPEFKAIEKIVPILWTTVPPE